MNNALMLIDFQHGMCAPEGLLAASGIAAEVASRDVLTAAQQAASGAREAGRPVIFVRLSFDEGFRNRTNRTPRFDDHETALRFVRGSTETEFFGVSPQDGDYVLDKGSVSPFASTELSGVLNRLSIDSLALAGVATHLAVESTARESADSGFDVTVLEDACAGPSELHSHSIEKVLPSFARVTTVANWLSES